MTRPQSVTGEWTPTVSVVIPAYNAEGTLEKCVESLLALNYPADAFELIVVDNGSTDNTAAILARYAERVRALREPMRGRSQARNAGLRAARHSIVAFTDADCTVDADWLSCIVRPLEDPGVGIAGGRILAARPCGAVEEFSEWLYDQQRAIEVSRPPYVATGNWASRRDVLLEAGGFDQGLRRGEDSDLSLRILQNGYWLAYAGGAVVYHPNRSNRRGLFAEAFWSGYYSVPVLLKHRTYLLGLGHRPVNSARYKKLAADCSCLLLGRAPEGDRLKTIFSAGKYAGKVCGCVRFGGLDL